MEKFFYTVCQIDNPLRYKEILFRHFNNAIFINNMDFTEGLELLVEGIKKDAEERIWQLYVSAYPHMSKDNFKDYKTFLNEYYPSYNGNPPKKLTKEKIMESVGEIINMVKGGS